ncbi:MAG: chromosome partitioning protein [Beggiatoa sp. IS2]|nr:MAG: chromosome partitioning protein [Beggiatoa sp. IS2]
MITVIGSLKGGSGKSTVAFNLVLWLMRMGKTVFTYDLDPQCTLSDAAQVRAEEGYEPALKIYSRYNKPQQKQPLDTEALIDVGAANMNGMKRAIALADRVVIPVAPSQADIWSAQRFLYIIASETRNRKPPTVLAFINRADTHSGVRETDQAEQALASLPGVKVLGSRLHQRTVYRRSFSEGLAVFELDPTGKSAQEFEVFANLLYPPSP